MTVVDASPYDLAHWHRRLAGESIEDLICEVLFRWALGPGRFVGVTVQDTIRSAVDQFKVSAPTQHVELYEGLWPTISRDLAGVLEQLISRDIADTLTGLAEDLRNVR
jgi:hypothetical protein